MGREREIVWRDPEKEIWGFHVHQELPLEDFARAIVIQRQCSRYLSSHGINVDADCAFRPGYGPHLGYTWELRVERQPALALRQLGRAISYMAVNRFRLSAYIHPLMHDPARPDDLESEGRLNQGNILWFSHKVRQRQDYFFNPDRDELARIVDTRTPRIIGEEEKAGLLRLGEEELGSAEFLLPEQAIRNGFHIHLDFGPEEEALALAVFDRYLTYLLQQGLRPTSTRLYGPGENGPHVRGGWEVKFETRSPEVLETIGIAVGWLMCNRQGLSVFAHPVTWEPGDVISELRAHTDYWMFIGEPPTLALDFFRQQIG